MRKKTFLRFAEYQTSGNRRSNLDEARSIHKETRFTSMISIIICRFCASILKPVNMTGQSIISMIWMPGCCMWIPPVKTGNIALDAILSGKMAKARERSIDITVKANVPDTLTLSDMELSIIVGNLLWTTQSRPAENPLPDSRFCASISQ